MWNKYIFRISVILSIVYCYAVVLWELVKKWEREDLYSYGFLIPVISIYLVWLKRKDLQEIEPKPEIPAGIGLLVAGLSILVLSRIGSMIVIQELSIIVTITGFIILIFGRQIFKVVWFPVLYLIFMIPIWDSLLEPLQYPFQSFSADIGVILLEMIGVPVLQNNIQIELPNITLVVASVCSGVNYLISVVAIGVPVSYLYLSSWWRRIFVIFLAALVAIASNGIRVAAIGLFSYYEGANAAGDIHGPFDLYRSMLISMIGFVVLFGAIFLLKDKDIAAKGPTGTIRSGRTGDVRSLKSAHVSGPVRHFFFIALILTFIAGTFVNFHKPRQVSLKNNFTDIPYTIGDWNGFDAKPFSLPANFKEFGVDEEVSRDYRDRLDNEIKLYVGYWRQQTQGKELINFKLNKLFENSYKYNVDKNTIYIYKERRYAKDADQTNDILIYWIDVNGRIVGNKYLAKAYTIWDFLTYGRTNNAIVMINIYKKNGEDIGQAIYRHKDFIEEIFPILKRYLPEI